MATKHAVLSASSSERWLNCPPSARLCETYEDKSSDYAAEGTDAHALAEARLKQALGIPTEDPVENLTWYNAEMEDCAQGYVPVLWCQSHRKMGRPHHSNAESAPEPFERPL